LGKQRGLRIQNHNGTGKKIGVHSDFVSRHLDAWEIRHEEHVDKRVSTDAIRVTRGLEVEERKKLLEKVAEGDLGCKRNIHRRQSSQKSFSTPKT